MNAQMASFSATVVLTALTCLVGTTANAETATMTMGCSHQVENPVKVSIEKRWGSVVTRITLMSSISDCTGQVLFWMLYQWKLNLHPKQS